ncbi:TspO/MBR family protein [Flavobacterium sp.]|uniref:TspO/MBR family protein n=1 Tax=Flavobacterium sp. TaxID=239 RepID=UPI003D6A2DE7
MKKTNYLKLTLSIAACVLIGILSCSITHSTLSTWYLKIEKPFFNPPSWACITVWTLLYIIMGYSFYIVWNRESRSVRGKKVIKNAMILFGVQLGLNLFWTYLFFGLCNPFLALIEILLLWLFIFETIKAFNRIDAFASRLLLPYLVWISCATLLNGSIWWLNC